VVPPKGNGRVAAARYRFAGNERHERKTAEHLHLGDVGSAADELAYPSSELLVVGQGRMLLSGDPDDSPPSLVGDAAQTTLQRPSCAARMVIHRTGMPSSRFRPGRQGTPIEDSEKGGSDG
jgi:hypothetical protein